MSNAEKEKLLLNDLSDSVINLDEEKAKNKSREVVTSGVDAYKAISDGLAKGMSVMGERYEKGKTFVPELLLASDAMYAGMDILRPHIVSEKVSPANKVYQAVIGVMEGDTHDIGKNLVKIMLEAAGFKVHDLGRDVPAEKFVETATRENADLICLSSLMTTAAIGMGDVVSNLKKQGVRNNFKVLIGGACVSQAYAQKIGADAYASNAAAAVKVSKELLGIN